MADITVDESILEYAVRYALGRQSYSVYDVIVTIDSQWKNLSQRSKFVILRDIKEHLEKYPEESSDIRSYWQTIYDKLSSKYSIPIV